MASDGSCHKVRSEELPSGLSDREGGGNSEDETSSVSGSSRSDGPEKLWIARSYLSKVEDEDGLKKYRDRYQIPDDVVLRIPNPDERACSSRYDDVAFYEADFNACLRFPMQPLMRELLDHLHLTPAQLAPNAWQTAISCMVLWQICSKGEDFLTMDELLYCYKPCQIAGLPWEEKDDSFIRVRRAWGTPPASALKHPKLDQDEINKVLRALHHREHRYRTFIQLEVLALYSFGPELNETVLFIQEINQKSEYLSSDGLCVLCVGRCFEKILFTGMATAKLNKEKLKKMMRQKDEALISLGKRWKTDSSSKKTVDKRDLPPSQPQEPSLPDPAPTPSVEVVEIPNAPSSNRPIEKAPTMPKDASLALRRAKSVVTKEDVGEYDKLNTDVVKRALAHSLMKGLTKAMVIANRCMQWEDGLVKQKAQLSKAAQANQRLTTIANELTQDRDRVVRELSSLKVLTSQMESIKISAVEEFKSSEANDDNNTKYFIAGFELLKKQAKEKYLDLDFEVFQPYEDDESVMLVDNGNEGTTSVDPQLDDDAAS
uniref:Uncharacterized protein n=1 Tax=Fagus sylvatica TaxID=28930 RepID=A0A2N9I3K9_FAGSY